MRRSLRFLLAAVALLAVMCAGAALAADKVEVDLKMGHMLWNEQQGDNFIPSPLPNNELRLWVTRRAGSLREDPEVIDMKGSRLYSRLILFSTKPTPDDAEGWLSNRTEPNAIGSGVIDGTHGISYEILYNNHIYISADVNAVSGDRATIYVYGGMMENPYAATPPTITSVQDVADKDVFPFPTDEISYDITTGKNGAVIASFDVVVLSSDADLLIEQIEADPELSSKIAAGMNVVEKDSRGKVTNVNKNKDKDHLPHLRVNLADGTVEIVVISSDARINIDRSYVNDYTPPLEANDTQAYLRAGDKHDPDAKEKTIFALKPSIDKSGTITYLIGAPDMLLALVEHLAANPGAVFHVDFDDLNAKFGCAIPEYSVSLSFDKGSKSSSSCAAGSAALIGLAALAAIKCRKR